MAWFRKRKKPKPVRHNQRSKVPEGLWTRCSGCREIIYTKELLKTAWVCPKCGYHFRLSIEQRVDLLLDSEGREEHFTELRPADPLGFVDSEPYPQRIVKYRKKSGLDEAIAIYTGRIDGEPVVLGVMSFAFMGGSMGSVVGEKLTRAVDLAISSRCALVVISASGGARMQEGALSLMQMAKVSAALGRLAGEKLPYLSILTDPTTGGVTASFSMLGDLNIAEPGALIGFTGPRVIEQTLKRSLPEGFQTSEFLLDHGFLDFVVPRVQLKNTVGRCLRHLSHSTER